MEKGLLFETLHNYDLAGFEADGDNQKMLCLWAKTKLWEVSNFLSK